MASGPDRVCLQRLGCYCADVWLNLLVKLRQGKPKVREKVWRRRSTCCKSS